MDICVVIAAAAAGYVAQQWKNLRKDRQSLSDYSCRSPSFAGAKFSQTGEAVQDKNLPPPESVNGKKFVEECCLGKESVLIDSPVADMKGGAYEDDDVRCDGKILRGFNNEEFQWNKEALRVCVSTDGENGEDIPHLPCVGEMGVSRVGMRKRRSLPIRKTNRQLLKPLSSLESCVIAQFYKEPSEMREYKVTSICAAHTPTIRPFLVMDGARGVINQAVTDPFGLPNAATRSKPVDTGPQEETCTSVLPQLPGVASKEFGRKLKSKTRMVQARKLSYSNRSAKVKGYDVQGSSDGALIFFLGVSIGIMSSLLANKQEVDKLNGLLRQSENLVQDLQEELEMKDSLTVKELAVEDHESQDPQNGDSKRGPNNVFSLEEKQDDYNKEYLKVEVEKESFSKIEAELEAELERLELNMSSCGRRKKPSELNELDAEYIPDVVEGELKVKVYNGAEDPQPYADLDGSGSYPAHPSNYVVSPRELSLRLHEVIQSKLERRVKELETALENRQREAQLIQSKHTNYWREFSNSNSGSSSTQTSPVLDMIEQQTNADESMVINISGDVLDAYGDAYQQETPFGLKGIYIQEVSETSDQYTWGYDGGLMHNNTLRNSFADERPTFSGLQRDRDDGIFGADYGISGYESEEGSEEMEKLLIQHIVEQARKGSPVVLNAQKVLFSPVDEQH